MSFNKTLSINVVGIWVTLFADRYSQMCRYYLRSPSELVFILINGYVFPHGPTQMQWIFETKFTTIKRQKLLAFLSPFRRRLFKNFNRKK